MKKNLYIWSDDSYAFSSIKEVRNYEVVKIGNTSFLEVDIDPAVTIHIDHLPDSEFSKLFLSARFSEQSESLKNQSAFPIYANAHVQLSHSEPLNNIDQLLNVAWVTIYDSRSDAEKDMIVDSTS